jgi:hypothetical protein
MSKRSADASSRAKHRKRALNTVLPKWVYDRLLAAEARWERTQRFFEQIEAQIEVDKQQASREE